MGDSIALSKINVSPTYNVGINLEKAIQNPGSHYDVVLQPGDALFIPEQQSTVKIAGDVMFPNTVVYEPGKNSATTSTRPAATDSAPARTKRLSYISTVLWLKQNAAPLSNRMSDYRALEARHLKYRLDKDSHTRYLILFCSRIGSDHHQHLQINRHDRG